MHGRVEPVDVNKTFGTKAVHQFLYLVLEASRFARSKDLSFEVLFFHITTANEARNLVNAASFKMLNFLRCIWNILILL